VPKPFLTSLSIGIPWIKLHTSFKMVLVELAIGCKDDQKHLTKFYTYFQNSEQRQRWSSIFKYFFKSPKKSIIRVCLNWIERMSLLWTKVKSIASNLSIPQSDFKASWQWLSWFKVRHGLQKMLLHEEGVKVNKNDPKLLASLEELYGIIA
jgi:hypothetical protein